MGNWGDFIWLITQPGFIALFLFGIALQPLLKFLRRYYPKSLRKAANDSDAFKEELAKNEQDSKLVRQIYIYEGVLIFVPSLLILTIYLCYAYLNGAVLTPYFIRSAVAGIFTPIMFVGLGIVGIKHDAILRHKLKADYKRYMKIFNKRNAVDPLAAFFEKHMNKFGYAFIVFGIVGFIVS